MKFGRLFFWPHVGHHVGHLVHLHVSYHVHLHVGHRNVVSMLSEVSEMLIEWKSVSVMADQQTYGRTDRLTGVGVRDTCVSKNE